MKWCSTELNSNKYFHLESPKFNKESVYFRFFKIKFNSSNFKGKIINLKNKKKNQFASDVIE